MLTESEVERSYRRLLKNQEISLELLDKCEALIEQLRPESPLRHRLGVEVDELRELSVSSG